MNALVTGGAGFIGSHLVEELLVQGHKVYVIDDLSTGKYEYLKEIEDHPHFHFIRGTVNDCSLLKNIIKDCDIVFHLAAVLGVKTTIEDPLKVIEGNIDGTRNVLEIASQNKCKVVFASTSEIYGKNEEIPFKEDVSNRILGPTTKHRWCYATAKALDEHLCFAYAEKGLPVTVLRYFNSYGPRATATQYGGVIPIFISQAIKDEPITVYGSGEQTRCFTYIQDTIQGTINCMDQKTNNQIINIGSEQKISINQLAEKIKFISKSSSPIIHIPYNKAYGEGYEDMMKRQPDLTKARTLLNYHPATTLDRGLRETITWYQKEMR